MQTLDYLNFFLFDFNFNFNLVFVFHLDIRMLLTLIFNGKDTTFVPAEILQIKEKKM